MTKPELGKANEMHAAKAIFMGLLIFALAASSICLGQEKVKLAEGEYTITRAPRKPENVGKVISHWTLWKLKDRTLQVEAKLDEPRGHVFQEFLFTSDLKPIGYNLLLSTKRQGGEKGEKLSLSCRLLPQLISCKEDKNSFELSIKESRYTFMLGEFYLIDLPWFLVSLIQNQREDIVRPIYSLGESDSGQRMIELDQPQKIHLIGPDKVTVMGRIVQANKYVLEGDWGTVWIAPSSGMVLAVETSGGGGRWELTQFKGYSSTYMPELH